MDQDPHPMGTTRATIGLATGALALVTLVVCTLCCSGAAWAEDAAAATEAAKELPFTVKSGLFDHSKPDTLGLPKAPGAETFTIFAPDAKNREGGSCRQLPFCPTFNHGVHISATTLDGRACLEAQWQACPQHEDSADGIRVYSLSFDEGCTWSPPRKVSDTLHTQSGKHPSGQAPRPATQAPPVGPGFRPHSWDGKTYVRFWSRYFGRGYAYSGAGPRRTEYSTSTDGVAWSKPQFVRDLQGNEIDGYLSPRMRLPGGRLINWDARITEGSRLVSAAYYTDDPAGITGWTRAERRSLPMGTRSTARECEPSTFYREDGALVVVFRDLGGSLRVLATMMKDRGERWTPLMVTGMPDSCSMQSAGNLPDGTAFMVNNPSGKMARCTGLFPGFAGDKSGHRERIPLAITLSKDGRRFDRSYLLRGGDGLQKMRYAGRHKVSGFSYPSSTVIGDFLYVSYAANKEDAQLTRAPLASLMLNRKAK